MLKPNTIWIDGFGSKVYLLYAKSNTIILGRNDSGVRLDYHIVNGRCPNMGVKFDLVRGYYED